MPEVVNPSRLGGIVRRFPLPLLRQGGDDTWDYVVNSVTELVNIPAGQVWVIQDNDGVVMSAASSPQAGRYVLD